MDILSGTGTFNSRQWHMVPGIPDLRSVLLPRVSDLPRSSIGGAGALQVRPASHVHWSYSRVSRDRMGGSVMGRRGPRHSCDRDIRFLPDSRRGEGAHLRVWRTVHIILYESQAARSFHVLETGA